jgi:hypothetical protein
MEPDPGGQRKFTPFQISPAKISGVGGNRKTYWQRQTQSKAAAS